MKLQKQIKIGSEVFIADTARVLGNVELGNQVSVWFSAVIRADLDKITIGERTNVQDGVIMHVDHGKPINIGKSNVIGHGAILHGCTIGDHSLIGMRATILNGAKIGKGCIIGAHALVKENMIVPDYSMVLGTPGKIVKQLPPTVTQGIEMGVLEYIKEAKKYLQI